MYPPDAMQGMPNDSFRSLASFVEDGCDFKMEGDYGQFPLADLLRHAGVTAPSELAHKKEQGSLRGGRVGRERQSGRPPE